MRRPPPLSQVPRFPLTAGLCLLAIGTTIAWHTGHSIANFTDSGVHFLDQPWRLITSMFPHVDVLHLLFNVYWTWVFGTLLERELGPLRLAAAVIILAAGSNAAELALLDGGVGLSGVGYGFFGMLWVMRRDPRFADAIDDRTIKTFVGWFVLCIVLTVLHMVPVANVAHAMGAVLGAILGWLIIRPRQRPLAGAALAGLLATIFLAASIARPLVNFSHHASAEYVNAACDDLKADRPQKALALLETAVRFRSADGYAWYNMGVAYGRLGNPAKAQACFREAVRISPNEKVFRDALDDAPTP
jgi:membrane associated rhomboid family serine protease